MTDPKPVAASKTIMSRTMLPSDANPYGNVHGGEIMKLIDACAGAAATRHARSRVVTARIDELSFLAPVYVGHLVTASASVNHVGRSSMEVGVRVDAEDLLSGKAAHVASAYLVFVSTDENGRPKPLPPLLAETDDAALQKDLLLGMSAALQGWTSLPAPQDWSAAYEKLAASGDEAVRGRVQGLSVIFGEERALAALRKTAGDEKADLGELRGKKVRLHFEVKGAALYAYRFTG